VVPERRALSTACFLKREEWRCSTSAMLCLVQPLLTLNEAYDSRAAKVWASFQGETMGISRHSAVR
jgi:hypothetical protein